VQLWVFAYSSLLFNRKITQCIEENQPLPANLPMVIQSNVKSDWLPYFDFLKEDGISAIPIKNLEPFSFMKVKRGYRKTREIAKIYKSKIVPEGVILSFSLKKGSYATSFLSHFFQLCSGLPQDNISKKIIDTKLLLGEQSITNITEKFQKIILPKAGVSNELL
jgi:tRNA(Glu) U13 pseudouridine synthase TruD